MKKSNFYVYIHVKPHNGEIFYVGKGRGDRAYRKDNRNTFWHNIVNKYGYDIFILENNLTEDEAFELEIKYIKRVGRRDLNAGTLVNMSDGGEGPTGRIFSEETRRKMSKSQTGRVISEEHRRKISEGSKGRKQPKRSEEHSRKISEALKGRKQPKHSEETKKKMSESQRKRWADRKAKSSLNINK